MAEANQSSAKLHASPGPIDILGLPSSILSNMHGFRFLAILRQRTCKQRSALFERALEEGTVGCLSAIESCCWCCGTALQVSLTDYDVQQVSHLDGIEDPCSPCSWHVAQKHGEFSGRKSR